MNRLQGKTAVITGGTSGIGFSTAKRFVAEGAHVFITGRRQAELEKAVDEIGGAVSGIRSDVASLEDLDGLFAIVGEKVGRLDILFANAGGGDLAPLGMITQEQFDRTFAINVRGGAVSRTATSLR